jgi:CheY-like chemotaxis protein
MINTTSGQERTKEMLEKSQNRTSESDDRPLSCLKNKCRWVKWCVSTAEDLTNATTRDFIDHEYLPEINFTPPARESLGKENLPTGTERILVIDDEQSIVNMEKLMLNRLGYKVVAKSNSMEALLLFEEAPDEFDLVITDITMPVMAGDRLAQKILDRRSDIPIIMCTGYNKSVTEEKARDIGIRDYILKPFSMSQLAKTVRKALDRG